MLYSFDRLHFFPRSRIFASSQQLSGLPQQVGCLLMPWLCTDRCSTVDNGKVSLLQAVTLPTACSSKSACFTSVTAVCAVEAAAAAAAAAANT
jgi:hypothetical protein